MVRIPRICLVVLLSFVLVATTVPAAHARTLAKPQSSHSSIGVWLDATLAWVTQLVTGTPHQGRTAPSSKLLSSTGDSGTGYAQPMTCSTIDPNGSPRCGGI